MFRCLRASEERAVHVDASAEFGYSNISGNCRNSLNQRCRKSSLFAIIFQNVAGEIFCVSRP